MKRKGPWEGERRQAPVFSFPLSFGCKFSSRSRYEADLLKFQLCFIRNTVDPRRGIGLIKFHSGVIHMHCKRTEENGYRKSDFPLYRSQSNAYQYGKGQMASFDDVTSLYPAQTSTR